MLAAGILHEYTFLNENTDNELLTFQHCLVTHTDKEPSIGEQA